MRIALIPAFEPDLKLVNTVRELRKTGFEVVIVNDGSGSRYHEVFEEAAAYGAVLSYRKNRGKGAVLKDGLQYIRQHYQPPFTVVTVDADGQHKTADVIRCCQEAEKQPEVLILGSRRDDGGQVRVPLRSRFGNALTRQVFWIRTGASVYDTQTGLRAFSDRLVPSLLNISGDRYEYEMNMLLAFADQKRPIVEIPVSKIYIDGNETSHFHPVKDSIRIYRCILKVPDVVKFGLSSLIGFLTDYGAYTALVTIAGWMGAPAVFAVTISNILARALSATVNFTINRKYVFRSREKTAVSAFQYAILAATILAGNTILLNILVEGAGISRYLAKLVTELTFFTLSWIVQKWIIFRDKPACSVKPEGYLTVCGKGEVE
ncbi:MAG: bifunctional glycosyltransferase family 2/GtrA family protein [Lachnospiraceae bacterium]|nr:bifunctional glycosyltransferase family 2/GtrA family protein [Lachnospiraceae bacterium]